MPGVGTTHHIKLDGQYYLIKPGTYQKRAAPAFGARFATGDPDYNNLSFWQHWAQNCFVGGMDAELWADDAMYHEGVGVNTTDHEKVTLARDLARGTGANWTVSSGTTAASGYNFIIYNSKLYIVTFPNLGVAGELWEYAPATDAWTKITAFTGVVTRSVAVFDGRLYLAGPGTSGGIVVKYSSGALGTWTTLTNPVGVTTAPYAMRAYQQRLYVAFGTQVWRLKSDNTWDGNTVFYNAAASSDSNYMAQMETHNGFLYMLSQNGHVHRSDGNTTLDMWSWDGQTIGTALRSFDGRLFIATYEYTNTADVGYGVLYQMTGSAMTELKRWGNDTVSTSVGQMRAYDRKLFYGAGNLLGMTTRQGFGVAVYDPVEDAHSIIASMCDTTTYPPGSAPYTKYIVDDVMFFGGFMFTAVKGFGVFKTPYRPRDVSLLQARYDVSADGWFTTSTYDAGTPGLRKMWRKIVVDYGIPATGGGSIKVEYSIDNGATWVVAGTITTTAERTRAEYSLENVFAVSLKLRFTLDSTLATRSPTFYGYTVSYIPVPEPNWLWSFTIVLSEKQVLLDGTVETVPTETRLAALRDMWRAKDLVNFIDVDGTEWAPTNRGGVLPYDIGFWLPDLNQDLEGEVQISLLEAVETY